jgi:Chitobiase/beta-hexosaminidase C-terminal domain/Family of unknown function (DUF6298)
MPKISCFLRAILQDRLTQLSLYLFRIVVSLILSLSVVTRSEAIGPLTVHPTNPRYFADSSGNAVYLSGAHLNNSLIDRSDEAVFDFSAYLDFLQKHKHNFIRLWISEQAAWTHEKTEKVEFHPLPYERTGPGTAIDGGLKFDLTRFNQNYFDRLRSRVVEAGQRGIYVSVMLFQGFGSQAINRRTNPWPGHPFHRHNNINGINGDRNRNGSGEEIHSLLIPSITALQEAYVRKVVDTLNDLENVLYEISGAAPPASKEWQYYMINYLNNYQAAKPKQHPVGMSYLYRGNTEDLLASPADWILLQGTDTEPPMATGAKVIFWDIDPNLLGAKTSHQLVWKSFMRGLNPIYLESDLQRSAVADNVRDSMGYASDYSHLVVLSSMSPDKELCSTTYCFVNPGSEYLIYLTSDRSVKVDLSSGAGDFLATWFSPTTGETIPGQAVKGASRVALTSPLSGDTVLYIHKAPATSNEASGNLSGTSPSNEAATSVTHETSSFTEPGRSSSSRHLSLSNAGPVTVAQGSSVTTTISTNLWSSKRYPVSFSINNLPPGVSASFSPNSCKPKCSTLLTIKASTLAVIGTYAITVKGEDEWKQATTTFSLSVVSASVNNLDPPTITPAGGAFINSVSVSLSNSAVGASIHYTTDGTTPTQSSNNYTAPFVVAATTLVKAKAFKSGSTPSSEASAWFTIEEGFNFSLSNSGNKSVIAGSSVTNMINATLVSGSTQSVTLSASGIPSDAMGSFSQGNCSPNCSSTLTLNTSSSTLPGNFPITVTASGGGVTKTTTFNLAVNLPTVATPTITPNGGTHTGSVSVTLQTSTSGASIYYTTNGSTPTQSSSLYTGTIALTSSALVRTKAFKTGHNPSAEASASFTVNQPFNFSLSNSGDRSVIAGSSVTNSINASLTSGNPQAVTFAVSGLPAGVTASFSNGSCVPSCASTLTIDATGSNSSGTSAVTVTAIGGAVSKTTSFNLTVNLPTLAAPTISPNGGNYTGSVSVTLQAANSGASIYYTTNGTTPTQSSALYTGAFTLTNSTTVKAKAFKNGSNPSSEASASFTITPMFNFALSNSGDRSVVAGSSVTNTITANLSSGTTQAVSFVASGLPTGTTASFSSGSCNPNCSSVLTIITTTSTPAGSSTLTVTANGGGVTKTTTFSLTVSLPTVATPTITPNGGNFTGSASVTIQTATAGASIFYTTNGTTPTQSSILYTQPFTLNTTALVKAKAFKSGSNPSGEASASFTIVSAQPAQLNLTWQDNSTNENGFQIERKTGTNGTYVQIASLAANVNSYLDTGLTNGTTYCYRVRAVNNSQTSGYTNEACGTTAPVN